MNTNNDSRFGRGSRKCPITISFNIRVVVEESLLDELNKRKPLGIQQKTTFFLIKKIYKPFATTYNLQKFRNNKKLFSKKPPEISLSEVI